MPSARLLDWWRCAAPPTSLSIAPDASLLATTHAGVMGVYLWSNRMQYDDIVLRAPAAEPVLMTLPTLAGAAGESEVAKQAAALKRQQEEAEIDSSSEQDGNKRVRASDGLVELAGLPRTRWATLSQLDVIRVCFLSLLPLLSLYCFFPNQQHSLSRVSSSTNNCVGIGT